MNNISIKKAGAIVLRDGTNGREVLLLYRGKQEDWGFPKGHIEEGETSQDAMQREIKEETGLDIKILGQLPSLNYLLSSGDKAELLMFAATPWPVDQQLIPEKTSDDLQWMPIDGVEKLLSYQNLKEYFNSIYSKIKMPLHG